MYVYVCMSENLYPVRLKQKSHSRTAVSNKQTRIQCLFEPFSGQVGWVQRGWETVPDPSSSDSETPITECTVGVLKNEHRSIRRSKRASTGVRDEQGTVAADRAVLSYYNNWHIIESLQQILSRTIEVYHSVVYSFHTDLFSQLIKLTGQCCNELVCVVKLSLQCPQLVLFTVTFSVWQRHCSHSRKPVQIVLLQTC